MGNPEKFIKGKYWSSEEFRAAADKSAERTRIREGKSIPNEPDARIENYLTRFTDILEREEEGERERGIEALRRLLHRKYIIKPENISDEHIRGILFGNFAEQKGYGQAELKDPDIKRDILKQFEAEYGANLDSYEIPDALRKEKKEMSIEDQKARLDSWLNYITGPEAENYPAAYRYWAFAEMLKLGSYDDERKAYHKRTETTAAPFPELDQQALALVFDEIIRKQNNEPSGFVARDAAFQNEFRKRLEGESFGKLYAAIQEHLKSLRFPEERLVITQGEWRTFPEGSDPEEVAKSLEGFHTQWCIAGKGTAGSYLSHADLHIYYSEDVDGKNVIPRACIVDSKEGGITEVRGIMSDDRSKQHLDDYITPVVEARLSRIPGGEKWQSTMKDMRQLAQIHIKHKQREKLTKEDLRFLYEVDRTIASTGYGRDTRITEILKGRDIKDDLSNVWGVPKEQISTTKEEACAGNISYHYGTLYLDSLTSAEGLNLPAHIGGDLSLDSLTSAEIEKLRKERPDLRIGL